MINLHFKIMDKMNLMLNTAYDLQMKTPQGDDGLQQIPPMDRVMFCNGDFMRKFRKYDGKSQHMTTELKSIFAHDIVLVPFFFEEPERGNMSTWNSAEVSETPHHMYGSNLGTVLGVIQVYKNQTLAIDRYRRLTRES